MHSTHFHDQVPSYSESLISHCVCLYIRLSVLVLALLVRAETFVFQIALVGQMYTYPTTQASISINVQFKNSIHLQQSAHHILEEMRITRLLGDIDIGNHCCHAEATTVCLAYAQVCLLGDRLVLLGSLRP